MNAIHGGDSERFLVTGALGCIGAWTVRQLVREGVPVVAFDLGRDPRRIALIVEPEELERVEFVAGDITDLATVERALDEHDITNVIHLAALQVPFCRADPPRGAEVNVTGTVNVFEAVKRRGSGMAQVVYTGSIGMFSPSDVDPVTGRLEEDADAHPGNHYGVF
jgi:UDP-glucuronate 4-epimerase